ncbi:MAG: hypothetical protein LBV29_04375 [Azoarcus sp.]|jgi:hypothetical protein|nr:hypothetical protein [Azoarcus sp.]
MKQDMKQKLAALGIACALVAGCGGGGGGGGSGGGGSGGGPEPQTTAEGIWDARPSASSFIKLVILENGDTWGLLMAEGLAGVVVAHTTSNAGQLSGQIFTGQGGSYVGSFVPKSSLRTTLLLPGFPSGAAFTASYDPRYDQAPAALSAIAGNYPGQGALPGAAVISPSGEVTVPAINGCGASGSIQPRASGKNIYDWTITFQSAEGALCNRGNGATLQGIAIYDTTTPSLLVLASNSARTDALLYSAPQQ